jgi:hypothetical protein
MDLFTIPKEDIIGQINRKGTFDKGNEEVLLWASINGYNDILQVLIDTHKADPDNFPLKVNKYWNLALRYAAEHGHIESVKILLDAGGAQPSHDIVTVTRNNKKVKTDYTIEISPECAKTLPERYNYLLLDWIIDTCTLSISNLIKECLESLDPTFTYTERLRDKETLEYLPRYHNKAKKKSK